MAESIAEDKWEGNHRDDGGDEETAVGWGSKHPQRICFNGAEEGKQEAEPEASELE